MTTIVSVGVVGILVWVQPVVLCKWARVVVRAGGCVFEASRGCKDHVAIHILLLELLGICADEVAAI